MSHRVLLVSQWYPPEPADIPESIAQALAGQGMGVEVLTGVPNYPSGRVHDGYSAGRRSSETIRNLAVRRTPLYPSHNKRALKRLANYASWAVSSALFGQREIRRSDVALVYSSPATAALPAMVGKVLWGRPYVLLVQDVWPDSIFASGFVAGPLGGLVRTLVNGFVQRSYAMAAHVAVISPGMADLLAERGVALEKLSVVYNWIPERTATHQDPAPAASFHDVLDLSPDARVFAYAGNHGRAQALEPLIDAFSTPASGEAHLVLLGAGVMKDALMRRAAGNPRIHFMDPVARDVADRLTSSADASVVSLADQPLFSVTMPSKVQSGLRAGVPMLVVARGDAAAVVEAARAGVVATPGDVSSISDAVMRLSMMPEADLSAMGRAGAATYESMMSERVGAPRLAAILNAAADQRGRWSTRTAPSSTPRSNEGNVQ